MCDININRLQSRDRLVHDCCWPTYWWSRPE